MLKSTQRIEWFMRGAGWMIRPLIARQPIESMQRVLILCPGRSFQEILPVTPLLRMIQQAYPDAKIDWGINDAMRYAVGTHPAVTHLFSLPDLRKESPDVEALNRLIDDIHAKAYDTVFVPTEDSFYPFVAWQAGIPQRIGIHLHGRGWTHTHWGKPAESRHRFSIAQAVGRAAGLDPAEGRVSFYADTHDQNHVMTFLLDEAQWDSLRPIVVIYPGLGESIDAEDAWPVERFALVANQVAQQRDLLVILVTDPAVEQIDSERLQAVLGLMSHQLKVVPAAGRFTMGQLAALFGLSTLLIGHETPLSWLAAAVGCRTLMIGAMWQVSPPAEGLPQQIRGFPGRGEAKSACGCTAGDG